MVGLSLLEAFQPLSYWPQALPTIPCVGVGCIMSIRPPTLCWCRRRNGMDMELHALGLQLLDQRRQQYAAAGSLQQLPQVMAQSSSNAGSGSSKPKGEMGGWHLASGAAAAHAHAVRRCQGTAPRACRHVQLARDVCCMPGAL